MPATSHDPNSVRSRSRYVITYGECPILWSSKLQSKITLFTTKAEYISLSQSHRDLIPLRAILQNLCTLFKLSIAQVIVQSTVFGDNKGCIVLIATPTMRPCSCHIEIKHHHFREHVHHGHIHIKWISTFEQLADIFTKPLVASKFLTNGMVVTP